MKQLTSLLLAGALLGTAITVEAGNPDRAGSAGAGQLLINPWAGSNGLAGMDMASARGIDAAFTNVAGLAFINKQELTFANTRYLSGSGISVNSVGFGTKLGESSVLALTVMSMGFGDIPITTEDLPEGGIGSFSPSFSNIGITYAKAFSNSIYGGITMRVIGEAISNVRASGVAFDAGIRYVTGEDERLRFGISLRNVGAPMRYAGDGLTVTATPQGSAINLTMLQRAERYELPSQVNIGFGYDVMKSEQLTTTVNGQFVSNSFTKDQYGVGVEARYRDRVTLRGGYVVEQGGMGEGNLSTAYNGPAGGFSVNIPAGLNGSYIGLDYGYRTTVNFAGNHSIGIRIVV